MNIIVVAGLFSLINLIYVLLLFADGKKLEQRLSERRTEFAVNFQEELLIKDHYATWMAARVCEAKSAGHARVQAPLESNPKTLFRP
jgi:hypothetical protein